MLNILLVHERAFSWFLSAPCMYVYMSHTNDVVVVVVVVLNRSLAAFAISTSTEISSK